MTKRFIFFLVMICVSFSIYGKNYEATAYGASSKDTTNTADAFAAILNEIITAKDNNPTIAFKKGTYHFYRDEKYSKEYYISNSDQDNPKYLGAIIENVNNLTIDGNGSKFIFHGRMLPFSIVHSKNVTMKNFSIDFADPKILQLTKIQSKDNNTYSVEAGANYCFEGSHLVLKGDGYRIVPIVANIFEGERKNIYPRTSDYVPSGFMFYGREVSPGIVSLSDVGLKAFPVGTKIAARSYAIPTPGIFVSNCENIILQNLIVHHSEGKGLLAQVTNNIKLDGFCVVAPTDSIRAYSTQSDATHFSGCKGVIDVQNCRFEGMMDDSINVHGTYLHLVRQLNSYTVIAKFMHNQTYGFDWGFSGDEVQFIKSSTMDGVGEKNRIASIEPYDINSIKGAKALKITFKEPLSRKLLNGRVGIENLTWTPEVVFNNNVVKNNRARGALFSSPRKTLCSNNTFETVSGSAILICGDCNGWYEGGSCKDVVIKANTFINNLTSVYQFTEAIISIYPVITHIGMQKGYFHSNIRIEENKFVTFDRPILYAKSVDGLDFTDNVVSGSKEFLPYHHNKFSFSFDRCTNVTIDKNRFMDSYSFNPFYDIKRVRSNLRKDFIIHHSRNF